MAGLAIKLDSIILQSTSTINTNDVCYCDIDLNPCEYIEPVFALVGGDAYKNDKSSFLFQKLQASDTITIELYKDESLVATITDNTYGTYYATFAAQSLYVGFIVEWEKVFNLLSGGTYRIKAQQTILGNTTTFESRLFKLKKYDDELADGTVKIETYQTGNIIGSSFDYTDLVSGGWYSSYRIKGFFGLPTPTFETDNYLDSNYSITQIQDKIKREYTLNTWLMPSEVANAILYDNVLSNRILLTDYNLVNYEVFRALELYPVSIENVEFIGREIRYTITFTDKKDNIIKRNF